MPADGLPVSQHFQQNTISSSSYNALQLSLEKRFSHACWFNFAYTYGKSLDNASTLKGLLIPLIQSSTVRCRSLTPA